MKGATGIGRPANVLGVLLAIALFDAAAGPATARLAVFALVPTNLVVEGLKRATNRTRPDGEQKRSNASFPSSHAANAAAIAWVFSSRWRRLTPAFWVLALLVAYSRMYLNRHYLSDVVVGFAIGIACAWLTARFLRRRAAAAATAAPAASPPAPGENLVG
jgi:membrane-associated phospholipid phosphatase